MNWKFTGEMPVYQQIVAKVRAAILTGELNPGGKIPSVRDFAAQAQVNPNTMQRALTELEREGLLISGGTSGRTVTQDRSALDKAREEALRELALACAEQFRIFGLTPGQAAAILEGLEKEEG
ncbi:MAG: GntR family transcriptional regulator [Eubacteriales bacterium]|nr:GntR family transcriptional regulator [Eubacteriales bacterium]